MPGRTSAEAVNNFLGPLQLALSCVTDGVVNVAGGYHPSDEPHAATLNGGLAVRLAGPRRLGLIVTMHYRVVEDPGLRGPWKVSTAAYIYELTDEQGQRIVAYHWHPAGRSAITWPHLHLAPVGQLGKAHLPTGRVALEQVLRLAVNELPVAPRRKDWAEVLERTQAAFDDWRPWA